MLRRLKILMMTCAGNNDHCFLWRPTYMMRMRLVGAHFVPSRVSGVCVCFTLVMGVAHGYARALIGLRTSCGTSVPPASHVRMHGHAYITHVREHGHAHITHV